MARSKDVVVFETQAPEAQPLEEGAPKKPSWMFEISMEVIIEGIGEVFCSLVEGVLGGL